MADWFKEARAVWPESRLVSSMSSTSSATGAMPGRREGLCVFCRELIDLGAPIDVIGFQGHFWSDRLTAPEDIWAIIEKSMRRSEPAHYEIIRVR